DRQHVVVVVQPGDAGGVEVVAEGGPHAAHLVRRDLLTLAGPAEHDAPVGLALRDRATDRGADGWVVDRLLAARAEVDDLVAERTQRPEQMRLEGEACMVGTDHDAHPRLRALVRPASRWHRPWPGVAVIEGRRW